MDGENRCGGSANQTHLHGEKQKNLARQAELTFDTSCLNGCDLSSIPCPLSRFGLDATTVEMGVEVRQYGELTEMEPASWPDGKFLKDILVQEGVALSNEQQDPLLWQVSARWALLNKYGYLQQMKPYEIGNGVPQLKFTPQEIETIQNLWNAVCSSEAGNTDLKDFLTARGKSNTRAMKWSTMDITPGLQFKLHAHPSLELIYCAKGDLHEVRMTGLPFSTTFEKLDDTRVQGPNLTTLHRPWRFGTLFQGEWLVNEVGSIHKSFTSSNGDGCLLLLLWGGSHADILPGQEPKEVNVQGAVDAMDQKLSSCKCSAWERLEETFLPESERSSK